MLHGFGVNGGLNVAKSLGHDKTDHGDEDETDREEQLEHARALAARIGVKALGEIHRDDHAKEARRRTLQTAANDHHPEVSALEEARSANDRNRDEKQQRRGNDHFLATEPLGQQTGDQRGRQRPPKRHADDPADLRLRESRRSLDVRQRRGNDADVHAVEKTTQPRHDQQELRIPFYRHFLFPFSFDLN